MHITDTIQQMYQLLAKLEFEQHALAEEVVASLNRAEILTRYALSQPEPEVVGVTDEEVPYSDPPQWCNTPDMGLAWKAGRTLGWQMSQRRYAPPHHRADARRAGGDGCRLCVHGQKSTQRGRQHYCRRADRCSGSNDEPNR